MTEADLTKVSDTQEVDPLIEVKIEGQDLWMIEEKDRGIMKAKDYLETEIGPETETDPEVGEEKDTDR